MQGNGRIRALIFDMDGTMIDSMPFHRRSWKAFIDGQGIAMDTDDLMRRTTGRTGIECMAELFGRPLPLAEAQALLHEKEELYRAMFAADFREVRGFTAFAAAAAARGLAIGVGTAGDRHNIAFAMDRLKMDPEPRTIVGGDEGLPGKPEPAIFLEVARRLGVAPAHCVVFEDAPLGIEAARRAGMQAVAVCTGHSAQELAGPHVLAAFADYAAPAALGFLDDNNIFGDRHDA